MNQRCYFHKHNQIEYFCSLKQCTLPLCQQCLTIHQEQHNAKNQQANIISYNQAYAKVEGQMKNKIEKNSQQKQSYLKKIKKDKDLALKYIEDYFKKVETAIQNYTKNFQQIQRKYQKLKKGSIKTVIYFYSGEINFQEFDFSSFKPISQQIKRCLNKPEPKQEQNKKDQIQTFRQKNNIDNEFQYVNIILDEKQHQKVRPRKKSIFPNQKEEQKINAHKNTNFPYLESDRPKIESLRKHPYKKQNKSFQKDNFQHNFYQRTYKNLLQQNQQSEHINMSKQPSNNYVKNLYQNFQRIQERNSNKLFSTNTQRNFKSKTLEKFPSMNQLKSPSMNDLYALQENCYKPVVEINTHNQIYNQNHNANFQPGKWNRQNTENEQQNNYGERKRSNYSEWQTNGQRQQVTQKYKQPEIKRKQLKADDLEPYVEQNEKITKPYQYREKELGNERGLRSTLSHTNLTMGSKRKYDNLQLNENLKKQVLSPLQIRKMLQKKIEQRNKVLTQKKQYHLKLNTIGNKEKRLQIDNGKQVPRWQRNIGEEGSIPKPEYLNEGQHQINNQNNFVYGNGYGYENKVVINYNYSNNNNITANNQRMFFHNNSSSSLPKNYQHNL